MCSAQIGRGEKSGRKSWHDGPERPTARALGIFHERGAEQPNTIGLCLSGGGYRAALFHLGALRRLNELGILARVDRISAVSGGAILAAYLAARLGEPWPTLAPEAWTKEIQEPFRRLTERDIRTPAMTSILRPPVEVLRESYADDITKSMALTDLPARPEIIFGAAELVHRRYWSASRVRVGDATAGYFDPGTGREVGADTGAPRVDPKFDRSAWTVARAVAASSCFPPVFPPMDVTALVPAWFLDGLERDIPRKLLLSDGGVYDNTGYMATWNKCDTVLVSDGGLAAQVAFAPTLAYRIARYSAIQDHAGRGWQKAFLLSNLISGQQRGAYWGLHTKTDNYKRDGQSVSLPAQYSEQAVEKLISRVRTDLARFEPAEQEVLINHGYLLAAAAVEAYLPRLTTRDGDVPVPDVPIAVPFPDQMGDEAVRQALASSAKVDVDAWTAIRYIAARSPRVVRELADAAGGRVGRERVP